VTVQTSSPGPEAGRTARQPEPGGPGSETPAIPRDAEHDDDVDALYLAGQLPSDDGEWLLVTELDGLPGAAFTVRHRVRLAAADTAAPGVPFGVTSGRVAITEQPPG
jgi:hypothetical protein